MVDKEEQPQSISSLDTAITLPSDMSGRFEERERSQFDESYDYENYQHEELYRSEEELSHHESDVDDTQGISLAERRMRNNNISQSHSEEGDTADRSIQADESWEGDHNSSQGQSQEDLEDSVYAMQTFTTGRLLKSNDHKQLESESSVELTNEQTLISKYQSNNSLEQWSNEEHPVDPMNNQQWYTESREEYYIEHEQQSEGSDDLVFEQHLETKSFEQSYQEYEQYIQEQFLESNQHAESSDKEDWISEKFSGVIETVRNLIDETKGENQDSELIWNACLSKNCSNELLQIIGGTTGNVLPQLSVTELLDAMSVTEQFREKMEEKYPEILKKRSSNPQIHDISIAFNPGDTFSLIDALNIVSLGNNLIWEVHRLILDEFMLILREQSKNWIKKAYSSRHEINRTESGHIITSLSQDVFSLVSVKLRIIRESLTGTSEALVMAACAIFGQLQREQRQSRDRFLKDFDLCCATANDFSRMSSVLEDVSFEFIDRSQLNQEHRQMLEDAVGSLVSLYGNDAVYAARSAYKFIMEPIEKSLRKHLFGKKWENDLTNNEIALKMTRTLNDFDSDLAEFLDEFFVTKISAAIVRAVTFFYIKCLLIKADQYVPRKNHYRGFFENNYVAMNRIEEDIRILREHFLKKAKSISHLEKAIDSEFGLLVVIHELFSIAAGHSDGNPIDYAIVLYKHIHDEFLTRLIMCDIWHLANPLMERYIWQLDIACVGAIHKEEFKEDLTLPSGLDPTYFFSDIYSKCERRRPIGILERRSVASKIREIIDLTC